MALDRKEALKAVVPAVIDEAESRLLARSTQDKRDYKSEMEQIDIENRREKQKLRKRWERLLRWLVMVGFLLSYAMIFLIGIKKLSFADNAFAVPSVVAVGIAQTYGLAKLAVNYFFSEDTRDKPTRPSQSHHDSEQ